jgi:hypothetical protein
MFGVARAAMTHVRLPFHGAARSFPTITSTTIRGCAGAARKDMNGKRPPAQLNAALGAQFAAINEQCPARVLVPYLQGQTSEAFRQHISNTEMIKHGSPYDAVIPLFLANDPDDVCLVGSGVLVLLEGRLFPADSGACNRSSGRAPLSFHPGRGSDNSSRRRICSTWTCR